MVDENSATSGEDENVSDRPSPEKLAAFAAAILGGGRSSGIHEIGVNGSVIEQTVAFLDEHMKPDLLNVSEPGTDIEALAYADKHGVHIIPASSFDDYRTNPLHRRGIATMLDLDSYIAHFNRFADADSVTFANNDRTAPSLTGVLDYHRAGADSDPRFGKHRVSHKFPLSDEWKAWNEQNSKLMNQEDFALFLEDRFIDVIPADIAYTSMTEAGRKFVDGLPGTGSSVSKIADPGKLMALASDLKVLENSVVGEARNLSTGEASIEFKNELQDAAGQKLMLPQLFVLGIPVFVNGQPYLVIARLRFRKTQGGLRFWYDLWRTDVVFDDAFDAACQRVSAETGKPVLIGIPEA